jgi:hypothetical protein
MMGFTNNIWPGLFALATAVTTANAPAFAQEQLKPNILVIMADDIGYWNISAYNRGMMGYRTRNIDRIANEGAIFTGVAPRLRLTKTLLLPVIPSTSTGSGFRSSWQFDNLYPVSLRDLLISRCYRV